MQGVYMANMYDIVIVGGGPGGYSAALYAARAGLHVVVLEKQRIGGQAVHSENIENYPGFDAGIDGLSLSEKMQRGAGRDRAGALHALSDRRKPPGTQRLAGKWKPSYRGRQHNMVDLHCQGYPDKRKILRRCAAAKDVQHGRYQ